MGEKDSDDFSRDRITFKEVENGIKSLNSGKAPGFDGVTKEHLTHAGISLVTALSILYNMILEAEYIPVNFRRGTQVPLYKGKNTSILEVNNYRGITLLTTFNKLFEVIMWKRMEKWWVGTGVLSPLQGACRKGVSCVHSALLLQESIATLRESNNQIK